MGVITEARLRRSRVRRRRPVVTLTIWTAAWEAEAESVEAEVEAWITRMEASQIPRFPLSLSPNIIQREEVTDTLQDQGGAAEAPLIKGARST